MTQMETRHYKRSIFEAPVEYTFFNRADIFQAQMLNCGEGGMFLKSKTQLQPGATLCIRLQEFSSIASRCANCPGLRTMTLAEVKWCRESLEPGALPYEFGVRYYEPDY